MSEDRDARQVRAGIATVIGLARLALALAAGASGTRGAPRAADSITRLGTGAWSWWLSSGPDWPGRRDQAQTWSPDSESIAFLSGGGLRAVSVRGGPEWWLVSGPVDSYALTSDWSTIAFKRGGELVVSNLDGTRCAARTPAGTR